MSWYSVLLERLILPAHSLLRGRQYGERRNFLEGSQWLPREAIQEFQWNELRALLKHAFESVPYYQKKYAGISFEDIRTWRDFATLPPLSREEIDEHRGDLCSRSYRGPLLPHSTGGSSGRPTRFYRTIESYDWRTAATDRVYEWTGWRLGERAVYLWGGPVGPVSRWQRRKEALYHRLRREAIFNTFSQTEAGWREIYEFCRQYRPKLVVGYVSSLEEVSHFLRRKQLPSPSPRAVIAAAEPLREAVRTRIENAMGSPVFNTYGSREFMSIAGECEQHRGLHINAENLVVETRCPVDAGPSEILVTDLHNFGMPFIRYEIGDVGLLDDAPCSCGRGLPRLKAVEGRVLDLMRSADGRLVPGEFFPHLLKEVPEIQRYQVVQESIDQIVILAVLYEELSQRSRALLDREIRGVFGEATRVQIRRVDEIHALPSGKRRVTVGLANMPS